MNVLARSILHTDSRPARTDPHRIIAVKGGRVYIDGKLRDPWHIDPSADCSICNLPKQFTIPPGHYFMMGDNRDVSADSRCCRFPAGQAPRI